MNSVVVIDPPAGAPVSLAEAKTHLRVDYTEDDTLIQSLIDAATARLDGPQGGLGRSLITQTLELRSWCFGVGSIELPYPPVIAVSSIKYDDTDGAEQTVDTSIYRTVGIGTYRPRVLLAYNKSWPTARWDAEAVRIKYTAGYGAAGSDVPAPIRQAVLLHVGTLYAQRETFVIGQTVAPLPAAEALLAPFRIY